MQTGAPNPSMGSMDGSAGLHAVLFDVHSYVLFYYLFLGNLNT